MPRPHHRPDPVRLLDLQAFCAVAEHLSFVAAARGTGMSTSTVTRSVQALEQVLGSELVNRSHRHVSLTPAGEAYYQAVKPALRQLAEAAAALDRPQAGLEGWVRFVAPPVLESRVLPQALEQVSRLHPGIQVDITFSDTAVDPAGAGLDFAIRGGYPASSQLIGQTLWRYERLLCASPAYVARHGLPLEPHALAGHRFVIHTGPRLLRGWRLQRQDQVVAVPAVATHRVNSGAGLLAMVDVGLGIARIADWIAAPLIAAGRLVQVCPDYSVVSRTGQVAEMHVVHQSHALSAASRAIIAAIREHAPPGMLRVAPRPASV
ncbi:LysR family transcriptional regulator [Stenotrophomonas sp. 24(2023)]|uniref:LysR family transcriptional regulator n=1 Tax=Stenotrophomonas sp. 24(2023) TaxID=3068324 RepID=UPI0027DF926D|nr:LysR family transcriptional regulator [Stenotrophomonas sp. 24(2023)]WMJ69290.1 LysR family transcriptional regulator [Stenotrophomonas sp. 24(2023)]